MTRSRTRLDQRGERICENVGGTWRVVKSCREDLRRTHGLGTGWAPAASRRTPTRSPSRSLYSGLLRGRDGAASSKLATLGAVAALALVGGAAAASGMGFGNVGAPASACDIPLSVMNEAFDSNTSFVTADWGGGSDARIAKGVRCDYVQSPRGQDNDGVVEVNALRQEPPDPLYLSILQSTVALSVGVRGEQSPVPIVITNGEEGDNGGGYMLCMSGDALWMVTVYDDPSSITYAGLDAVAKAIGCEPQP